jgi:hypothetical protein
MANRVLESKIAQVLKAASQYFGRTFTDIDQLIDMLKQPCCPAEDGEIERVLTKLKPSRRLLKYSSDATTALSNYISELKRHIADLERNAPPLRS